MRCWLWITFYEINAMITKCRKCCITSHAANCEFLLMHHTTASLVPNESILQHCSLDLVAVKSCCEKHDCNISDWYWKFLVYCLVNFDMRLWWWKVELLSSKYSAILSIGLKKVIDSLQETEKLRVADENSQIFSRRLCTGKYWKASR